MSWSWPAGGGHGCGADGPDGGDPGQAGAELPLLGEVVPEARAEMCGEVSAALQREQGGIADEQGRVVVAEHGLGVGRGGAELGVRAEEVAEEDLGVGDGAA